MKNTSETTSAVTVSKLMDNRLTTISPQTDIREAAEIMVRQKISALMVVEGTQVVGLLTREDLLRVLIDVLEERPGELKRVEALIYASPLGDVVNALSNAGI